MPRRWIDSPSQWPQADFVPTALMRRTWKDLEALTGARFASFEDEGLPSVGACALLQNEEPVVLVQHLPTERSPSIYLRSVHANDRDHLNAVLREIGLDADDVVFGHDSYHLRDLQDGAHLKR